MKIVILLFVSLIQGCQKRLMEVGQEKIIKLAKNVKGIDVIISGHSHSRLDKPLIVNGIPIVQTGSYGKFVGRLSLKYSDGKIKVESYKLIPVDDKIIGDKLIRQSY